MKVILLQNVLNLGKKHDIKEVHDGYAHNFLLKRKLAVIATPGMLKQIEKQKEVEEKNLAEKQRIYHELVKKLKEINFLSLTIEVGKEGGEGFEAISKKDICKVLEKKYDINLPEESVLDMSKIKEKGDYDISIKFPFGISSPLKLKVEEKVK